MGIHITKEEREFLAARRAEALIEQGSAALASTDKPTLAKRTKLNLAGGSAPTQAQAKSFVSGSVAAKRTSEWGPATPRIAEGKHFVLYETGTIGLKLPGRGNRTLVAAASAWPAASKQWDEVGAELIEILAVASDKGFC